MIVVADTSPLLYLISIGVSDVLPELFDEVVIPAAVRRELAVDKAPAIIREWAGSLPPWAVDAEPAVIVNPYAVRGLDAGEAEVILIGMERSADTLLIDEIKARRRAEALGFTVAGTLAILLRAHAAELLDVREALEALGNTTFYLPDRLRNLVLRKAGL